VYFGRVEDGVLESPFAGNLVEVCPTGVFTDKPFRRHYTRKWDLQTAPSICGHCGLGCNTLVGSRYGSVRRVTSRFNGEVNGYWLCDRGRFGYEHLNAGDRLLHPQTPRREPGERADPTSAWHEAAAALAGADAAGSLAAVGSPRAGLEANFALRALAGPERFCCGVADAEHTLVSRWARAAAAGAFHVPSLQQVEQADVILVLGADLTHEAPLLDLALYRAHARGAAVHVLALSPGRVGTFRHAASAAGNGGTPHARLDGAAVTARAAALASALRRVGTPKDVPPHVVELSAALAAAQRPLVVTGTQHRDAALLDAALDLVDAIGQAGDITPWCTLAPAEADTLGVVLIDDHRGLTVAALIEAIERGDVTALVVGENDLFARTEDQRRLDGALRRLDALVLLDHMVTATAGIATHAFPAAAAAESSGTLVNNEGRMQRFYQVLRPVEGVRPTWSLARDLMPAGRSVPWRHFEDVTAALEAELPAFEGATSVAPPASFRQVHQPVPRMLHRYSGRNATLERDGLEGLAAAGPRGELPVVRRSSEDHETPLAFTMEGFSATAPPSLRTSVWAPGWNSNEAINQFQIEVGGPLHGGDPGRRIFAAREAPDRSIAPAATPPPARSVPPAGDEPGRLLVHAAAEIFGSDAMARCASALAELAPDNYLRLHPRAAAALGLAHGEVRRLTLAGEPLEAVLEAAILVDDTLPQHVAIIPAGYPATRWWQRPVWLRITAGKACP
jgi:NADH-quinone oxidoreductase subunit G